MTATLVRTIGLCVGLVLGGCSTRSATLPSAPARAQTASVTFVLQIPQNTSGRQRKPAFLSGFVKSVSITITGASGPPTGPFVGNCNSGGFCSQTVDAPIGQDTFAVSLYDGLNATGLLLSSGSATAVVAAGQSNTVTVTFNPVIGSSTSLYLPSAVPAGTPSSTPVVLIARDPRGATIVSPGTFEKPDGSPTTLTITLNDPTGHFALVGPTSYTTAQPSGALSLTYDGALLKFATPQLTVSQDGTPLATVPVNELPSPVSSVTLTPANVNATSLAEGPDGNVWFTASNPNGPTSSEAGRYAIASAAVSHYPLPNADADPLLATAGGDGAVWFFEQNRLRFAHVTTTGTVQEFNATFAVSAMAKGPDGNVWYLTTQAPPRIGKITPTGTITTYAVPDDGLERTALTAGFGRLWMIADSVGGTFANAGLASIATDGTGYTTTTLSGIGQDSPNLGTLYLGRDGNFYFARQRGSNVSALVVHRITPSGTATDLCEVASHNSTLPSTIFDDGTIVFATFGGQSYPALAAVLPSGTCRTAVFTGAHPIYNAQLISGASDGWLYVYDSYHALQKYAY